MKNMKTIGLFIFFLLASSLSALDFDWGGALQNTTGFDSIDGVSLNQESSLALWAELNILPLINVKASGGYKFSYKKSVITHIPEFSSLYMFGGIDQFRYKTGRFTFEDMNKNLFSTIIDGAEVIIKTDILSLKGGAGFSGLVFGQNSSVALTSVDFEAMGNNALLASPRIAEYVEIALHVLPGDGVFSVAILAQQDMRTRSSLYYGEGLLHSFYLDLGLKGRLANVLYYNFHGIVELGLYDMPVDNRVLPVFAGAGGLKIDLPLNLPLSPLVSAELYYSSGDSWARGDHTGTNIDLSKTSLNQYTPFTLNNKGFVYSIGVGNLMYRKLSISIKPIEILSISVDSLSILRALNGPVSTLPITEATSTSSLYLGEEINLTVNFRPLSDLGFQVKGGIFIPNGDVVSDGIQYKVDGFLSMSF